MSTEHAKKKPHLVPDSRASRARGKLRAAVFTASDIVPATAIYTVAHAHHQLPTHVTLRGGCAFPPCSRCDEPVEFRYLRNAEPDAADRFHVTLNVLPVLDLEADQELEPPRWVALAG